MLEKRLEKRGLSALVRPPRAPRPRQLVRHGHFHVNGRAGQHPELTGQGG